MATLHSAPRQPQRQSRLSRKLQRLEHNCRVLSCDRQDQRDTAERLSAALEYAAAMAAEQPVACAAMDPEVIATLDLRYHN